MTRELSLEAFLEIFEEGRVPILDVRNAWETPFVKGPQVTQIPIHLIPGSLDKLPRDEDLIILCQHGVRSVQVVQYLESQHGFTNLINLTGGVHLWKGSS